LVGLPEGIVDPPPACDASAPRSGRLACSIEIAGPGEEAAFVILEPIAMPSIRARHRLSAPIEVCNRHDAILRIERHPLLMTKKSEEIRPSPRGCVRRVVELSADDIPALIE